jgi:hypothetical protein
VWEPQCGSAAIEIEDQGPAQAYRARGLRLAVELFGHAAACAASCRWLVAPVVRSALGAQQGGTARRSVAWRLISCAFGGLVTGQGAVLLRPPRWMAVLDWAIVG